MPADNNPAERELRPLVIARKLSFGSQSDAGAGTREILMTVLRTLKKQSDNPAAVFQNAPEKLSANPDLNIFQAVFQKTTEKK
ncbi:MAG: transposase [Spirochaetia bacterium]|nr:transposase [Spirochaetia bacterium]